MKHKIISIIAAAAAVLSTAACNRGVEVDPNGNFQDLPIQPDALVIDAEGVDGSISFDAPDYWFANCPDKWVTVDPYSGKPGKITLDFKVAKNTTSVERTAVITVNAKSHKGKITITQGAWPYTDGWSIYGTLGGSNWDQDFFMEDQGDGLVWKAEKLPYHEGEAFKFRMGGSDAMTMGLAGEPSYTEGAIGFEGQLARGGGNITLPVEGYWDITVDLVTLQVTAVLAERFTWAMIGTVNGGDWSQDMGMTDLDDRLVWEVSELLYHPGEEFMFRMDADDAYVFGLDGELAAEGDACVGKLVKGGESITLPAEGYWTITLDVKTMTMTALYLRPFTPDPPVIPRGWAPIWQNDDIHRSVSWSSDYRFAGEGFETGEEISIIPSDQWAKMKSLPFYLLLYGGNPAVRVTTGWWSTTLTPSDITPGSPLITDAGKGYWILKVSLAEAEALLAALDQQHLLFTGDGYTPYGLYYDMEEWGESTVTVKTTLWKNADPDGNGSASWNGTYRFAGEGSGTGEEIAVLDAASWSRIKNGPFYMTYSAADPTSYQIRVTTGWWSVQWLGAENDIAPWNMAERIIDNGDGTFSILVDFSEDPAIVDVLDQQHLLFTGSGYTPLEIYVTDEVPAPKQVTVWENDNPAGNGVVSWNGTYRFAGEGFGTGEEIAVIPAADWALLKSEPFYLVYGAADPTSYQIRVTTGWWSVQWLGAENDIAPWNMAERITDNGDGTFSILVDFSEDPAIVDVLDQQHLLFTGSGYTPLRIYQEY